MSGERGGMKSSSDRKWGGVGKLGVMADGRISGDITVDRGKTGRGMK